MSQGELARSWLDVFSRPGALVRLALLSLALAGCGPRTVHIGDLLERKAKHPMRLHQAAARGDVGRMRRIIGRNPAAVNEPDTEKWTPLHFAAIWGEADAAEVLLEGGADLDARNTDANTPLILAAAYGEKAVVGLLLDRGASVDAKGRHGLAPLHHAACNGKSSTAKLIAVRVKGGCWFASTSPDCPPAMTVGGFKGIAEMLLDSGANVNARDSDEATPLMLASRGGYCEVVKLLLARKADVRSKNKHGMTALHYLGDSLVHLGFGSPEEPGRVGVLELLLTAGADPNSRDKNDCTPLHGARDIDLARALLEAGADVNARDKNGLTAVWTPTLKKAKKRPEFVEFLRERGGAE